MVNYYKHFTLFKPHHPHICLHFSQCSEFACKNLVAVSQYSQVEGGIWDHTSEHSQQTLHEHMGNKIMIQ